MLSNNITGLERTKDIYNNANVGSETTTNLLIEQEKTRQKEFDYKIAKIEAETSFLIAKEKNKQAEIELNIMKEKTLQLPMQLKLAELHSMQHTYMPIEIVEQTVALKPTIQRVETIEPINVASFVSKYCILREDTAKNKCRVKLVDFYTKYQDVMYEDNQPFVSEADVVAYICNDLKLDKKVTTWNRKACMTLFGIQLI
jgi:hypothetical protein